MYVPETVNAKKKKRGKTPRFFTINFNFCIHLSKKDKSYCNNFFTILCNISFFLDIFLHTFDLTSVYVCMFYVHSLIDDGTASVLGEFTTHMQRHWKCPRCHDSMIINLTERLEHESECQEQNITGKYL